MQYRQFCLDTVHDYKRCPFDVRCVVCCLKLLHAMPTCICMSTALVTFQICLPACCQFDVSVGKFRQRVRTQSNCSCHENLLCRATNRAIIDLSNGLFGSASTATADHKAISRRRAHGTLMAVNFILVFPLGALGARQLRSHWLKSPRIRAALFYVHIITQVTRRQIVTWCLHKI